MTEYKGADQVAQIGSLVSAFVVQIKQHQFYHNINDTGLTGEDPEQIG